MGSLEEGPPIPSFNLYERCDGENGDAFRGPLIFTRIRTEYYMSEHNGPGISLVGNIINEMCGLYLLILKYS